MRQTKKKEEKKKVVACCWPATQIINSPNRISDTRNGLPIESYICRSWMAVGRKREVRVKSIHPQQAVPPNPCWLRAVRVAINVRHWCGLDHRGKQDLSRPPPVSANSGKGRVLHGVEIVVLARVLREPWAHPRHVESLCLPDLPCFVPLQHSICGRRR